MPAPLSGYVRMPRFSLKPKKNVMHSLFFRNPPPFEVKQFFFFFIIERALCGVSSCNLIILGDRKTDPKDLWHNRASIQILRSALRLSSLVSKPIVEQSVMQPAQL